ncbi:MAG: RICIN domain-containing protein [bacterium]|nr:RICIN domain-containing protein [bacterium]
MKKLLFLLLFAYLRASSQNFDVNQFYKLSTSWLGESKVLDLVLVGDRYFLQMSDPSDKESQYWKLTNSGNGNYRISNRSLGDSKAIDVINDGVNTQLHVVNVGQYSGQFWKISPLENGFFRITNLWQGETKSLDIVNDGKNNKLQLANTGGYSGQLWKIVPVQLPVKLSSQDPVQLDVNPRGYIVDPGKTISSVVIYHDHQDVTNEWTKNNLCVKIIYSAQSGSEWKELATEAQCGTVQEGFLIKYHDFTWDNKVRYELKRIEVSINGDDACLIDKVVLLEKTEGEPVKEIQHWGLSGKRAWCLSTDPQDKNGGWKDIINSCNPTISFEVSTGKASVGE